MLQCYDDFVVPQIEMNPAICFAVLLEFSVNSAMVVGIEFKAARCLDEGNANS